MSEDKKINTGALPQATTRTTTQQPEEFIDKASTEKDELDTPRPPADESGDTRRQHGSQESA